MKLTRILAITTAVALAAVVPSMPASAHDGEEHEAPSELSPAQRRVIRQATKQYRDVDAALAAGYLPTSQCAELPSVGGMGYHYVNPALLADGIIDPTKPEILVYHLTKSGKLRLGAVEYFAVDADQNLATDADRPSLMGHPFDGPMPGHEPGMPVHYDLHAWVFTDNPAGELAAWNPTVRCP